jgi:hypothetical protein
LRCRTAGRSWLGLDRAPGQIQDELQTILSTKLKNTGIMTNVSKMQAEAKQRHQEVLDMINGLSDTASSDRASMVCYFFKFTTNFANFNPDKQGLYSIINQVCSSATLATRLLNSLQLKINLNATIRAQDIPWP